MGSWTGKAGVHAEKEASQDEDDQHDQEDGGGWTETYHFDVASRCLSWPGRSASDGHQTGENRQMDAPQEDAEQRSASAPVFGPPTPSQPDRCHPSSMRAGWIGASVDAISKCDQTDAFLGAGHQLGSIRVMAFVSSI